eukprot:TRINITY_DN22450_c0_g1_i1.p1 TRINITY_DN22450_c0_g1~~TRINITY_DN22450_c0_g1_i1.p1  ORF type:complete len:747 (-),score=114.10 TRINITY_DN22450_c0_g1_i1:221-2461(-)
MHFGWQAQRQQQADADHEASSGNGIHGFFGGFFDGFFSGRGSAGTYQDPSTASALPAQQRLQASGQMMQPQPLAAVGGGTSSSYAPQQSQYWHQPQQQPLPQQQVVNHNQSHMQSGMGTGPVASGQVMMPSASAFPARQHQPPTAGASTESFYSFFTGIFQPGQGANASVKPEGNQINGAQAGSHPSRNVNDTGYQHSGNGAQVLDRSHVHKVDNSVSRERELSPGRNRGVSPAPCRQASQQQFDREDILDQHVAYFLRHTPEVQKNVSCVRKRPGVYEVEGIEVTVEWQYSEEPGGQGYLIVLDGPTPFAPFADFMKGQSSAKIASQKAQSQATGLGTNYSYTPPPVIDPAYGGYGPSAAGTPAANTHHQPHGRGGTACGQNEQIPPEAFVPSPAGGGPQIVDVGVSKPKGADQTGRELSIGQQSTTFGGSNAESNSDGRKQSKDEYCADSEDLLDQHVAYYLRHNPDVHTRVQTVRKSPGVYVVNGREIFVEWQSATTPGGQGFLVAVDGPLRQPFAHYMKMSEADAEYDSHGIRTAPLHTIPKEKRLTFGDQGNVYTRLDAMKVAKAQAQYRERAADFVHQGQQVPVDIMQKYEKTLQQKLGGAGKKKHRPPAQAPPPAHTPAVGGGCTAGCGGGGVGSGCNVGGPMVPPAGAMGAGLLGGPQLMLGGGQVMGDRSATAGLQQPMLAGQAHAVVRQGTPAHPGFPGGCGGSPLMPYQQPSMSRSGGSGRLPPGHPAPYAGFRA